MMMTVNLMNSICQHRIIKQPRIKACKQSYMNISLRANHQMSIGAAEQPPSLHVQ